MTLNHVKLLLPYSLRVATLTVFFGACSGDSPSSQQRDARWHNNQGVVQMDQHQYARAVDEFSMAVALDLEYPIGLANLGIAYFSLGKYDSAAVASETALRFDPDNLHAHYTIGLIRSAQGTQYETALSSFERVASVDTDDPLVLYYRGQVKAKMGNANSAIEDFKAAIRLDSLNVSAYYALANQYRRVGAKDKWLETLNRFDQLSRDGHSGVNSSYQGQGKYAEVVADASLARPNEDDTGGAFTFSVTPQASRSGRFAVVADIDQDGDQDLLVGPEPSSVIENNGGAFFASAVVATEDTDNNAVIGDLNNDARRNVVLTGPTTRSYGQEVDGTWELLQEVPSSNAVVLSDTDHDGDLDMLSLQEEGLRYYQNDGTGTLTPQSDPNGLYAERRLDKVICSDRDNDRDVDCLALSAGQLSVFSNNRDGSFTPSTIQLEKSLPSVRDFIIEDFTQDGRMDLVVLTVDGTIAFFENSKDGFTFVDQGPDVVVSLRTLLAVDLDNDGDLDIVGAGTDGLHLFSYFRKRLGSGTKGDYSAPATCVLPADFDSDGDIDLWVNGDLLTNESDGRNWLGISLEGLNSNKDGIGAKIEVKTTNRLQKKEVRGDGAGPLQVNIGLAAADSVEFVRILWPSGVRQTEPAMATNRTLRLTELNRKGTSCPIVYAWNGERFRFVSDIMGGAIIGYLLGPGQYNQPDTDEYLPIGDIAVRDGKYVIQLANQLEEIIYTDAVHLIAVEHRRGTVVLPNERLLSSPPYPEFSVYALEGLCPPLAATDQLGRDILEKIRNVDNNWVDDFELTDIHGYASEHHVILDFGDLSSIHRPVLVAHGWVDYAHSTSNWAAAQRGWKLHPPALEVPDQHGDWVEVTTDMGVPAGLPKHMVFDLTGAFLNDDYKVRISTNVAVYWDQFLIGEAVDGVRAVRRILPSRSDLHWRGYPKHSAIGETFAFTYDYDDLATDADWGSHSGSFTRYGDVTALTDEVDDRYVILFHGDELTLEFADTLPPLDANTERTFLLYADGFGKDMDYHSAYSLTVEPLPFHSMASYPYGPDESYPNSEAHRAYRTEYNSRRIKGYFE